MKLRMAENSLFAILLRSPWWASFAVALAAFAALRLIVPALYASFFAFPFQVIGCIALWKQLRAPSARSIERGLAAIAAMPWDEFASALERHFAGQGYAVTRLRGDDVDFELARSGGTVLVAAKRWKAARVGVEPLRQLKEAARRRDGADCIYVAAGEVSEPARDFTLRNRISILQGAALAQVYSAS